jgi:hypothetical protein
VNGVHVDMPYAARSGKIEVRTITLGPDTLASEDDKGAIEIPRFDAAGSGTSHDAGSQDRKARDRVVLSMAGFSAAYAKLRKVCTDTTRADNGCSPGDASPRCIADALKKRHATPSSPGGQAAWPAK